jgi:DNA polymerase
MTSEMPKKYWHNLPEATLIGPLIASAGKRSAAMIEEEPMPRQAFQEPPLEVDTVDQLAAAARACTRCPLYRDATQTVFGEGPATAPMMLVGEQPGDQEDLRGKPFVGPAGLLLDRALSEAGIERSQVYVTNAVKHFKFEPRGKRRLHKRPNNEEIQHCRWWLDQERSLIRPRLVVALGATAAYSLLHKTVNISRSRGRKLELEDGSGLMVTVHPSYLLRLPDATSKAEQYDLFVQDLSAAAALLPAGAGES